MAVQRTPMTRTGYEKLAAELDRLKRVDRRAITKAIAEARAHGPHAHRPDRGRQRPRPAAERKEDLRDPRSQFPLEGVAMPQAAVDGIKLYYEEAGQGSPLIFVHEFAGDYRSWRPQVQFFS